MQGQLTPKYVEVQLTPEQKTIQFSELWKEELSDGDDSSDSCSDVDGYNSVSDVDECNDVSDDEPIEKSKEDEAEEMLQRAEEIWAKEDQVQKSDEINLYTSKQDEINLYAQKPDELNLYARDLNVIKANDLYAQKSSDINLFEEMCEQTNNRQSLKRTSSNTDTSVKIETRKKIKTSDAENDTSKKDIEEKKIIDRFVDDLQFPYAINELFNKEKAIKYIFDKISELRSNYVVGDVNDNFNTFQLFWLKICDYCLGCHVDKQVAGSFKYRKMLISYNELFVDILHLDLKFSIKLHVPLCRDLSSVVNEYLNYTSAQDISDYEDVFYRIEVLWHM